MTIHDLASMTVIQLRKVARENHIILGAGVEKAAMVKKIASALNLDDLPQQQSILDLPEIKDQMDLPASHTVP